MNKKRPFRENYNMSRITTDNASSVTECTGLEPTPPQSEDEKDSYGSIYNFFPDEIVINTKKDAE